MTVIGTLSCINAVDPDVNSSEIVSDSAPGDASEIQASPDASDETGNGNSQEPLKSEIYVSPDASDETGNGSSQKPFKSLKWAIDNSENESTIYLNDGEYSGDSNRNLKVDKSITIIGKSKQNTIINAESSGRLFTMTSNSSLTLINLTLMNGYSAEDGGSIYSEGKEITIRNCIVKNSYGYKNAGVICNNLGSITIEDSCFTNNSAFDYGGVIYTWGTTVIKNSNFTENFVTSREAVGACIASGGKMDLDGCLFYNCHSPYSAGGLVSYGNATINNCRFERLSTDYAAGAISNHGHMTINNTYFGYNDVKYYAGAILEYAGEDVNETGGPYVTTYVYNSVFEKNHAGYHGAVSNNFKKTYLHLKNCALIDNYILENERYGDIALDDNATLEYCWWGKNGINPYYYSRHNGVNKPEKINASRWLIMTFSADNDVIYKDEVNRLTISLKYYFDNETKEIHEYDGEFDLPLDVTFYTNAGTLGTKKLVNGVATFDFNPKNDVSVVYAKINNQILEIGDFKLRKAEIIASDFEKYYGGNSKLSVKLVNENNIPLSNEKLTVTLGGIKYNIQTDKNGMAKLTIKNKPNTYVAKITYNGKNYAVSSKSIKVKVVKPIIKASKLKIRKKGKFTVTFKDANKKAIKNVKVKFKIKGKTYIRTTNSKGQAKLTINLKIGKKYTVKVGFKNTAYYRTTTLTKKIKVNK